MKKICIFIACLLLVTGCNTKEKDRLTIVTTMFPQYDFVRTIVKDKADVLLLVQPGMETHHYDPTPSDMVTILNADLFVFNGERMESWANRMLVDVEKDKILDLSTTVLTLKEDPHIWTSPRNVQKMVQSITEKLCNIDTKNCAFYQEQSENYKSELQILDQEFIEIQKEVKTPLIFGSRMAITYFLNDYGFEAISAYANCGSETEPSLKSVSSLIEKIKEENIPYIFYQELENLDITNTILAETKKDALLFHSCHNVTKEEFERGETYLSLMKKNAENLRKLMS